MTYVIGQDRLYPDRLPKFPLRQGGSEGVPRLQDEAEAHMKAYHEDRRGHFRLFAYGIELKNDLDCLVQARLK